jgi:hypothetical protein
MPNLKLNFGNEPTNDPKEILRQVSNAFHRDYERNRKQRAQAPEQFLQPVIFYTSLVNRFPRKPVAVTIPFYSQNVFMRSEDAEAFLPTFLNDLIKNGDVPKEVILENETVDETVIEFAVSPLTLTFVDRGDRGVETTEL